MALNLYITTCRLVIRAKSDSSEDLAEICRYLPPLRRALACCVCRNVIAIPTGPSNSACLHHVCKSCIGGKMRLRPSCSWCKNYEEFVENSLLRIVVQCYKKLCEYLSSKHTLSRISNLANGVDCNNQEILELIREGVALTDNFDYSSTVDDKSTLNEVTRPINNAVKPKSTSAVATKSVVRGKNSRKFRFRKKLKEKQQRALAAELSESTSSVADATCSNYDGGAITGSNLRSIRNCGSSHRVTNNGVQNGDSSVGPGVNHVVARPVKDERKQVNDHVDEIIRSVTESAAKYGEQIDEQSQQQQQIHDNHSATESQNSDSSRHHGVSSSNHVSPTKQTFRLEHDPLEALSPEKITARVCIEHDYMKDSATYYSVTMSSDTEPKLTIRRRPAVDYANDKKHLQVDNLGLVSAATSGQNDAFGLTAAVKPRKIPRPRKDKLQKKKGCRCGTATPTPGKLTCCGQRCPCYTSYKPCVDCSCRGCHNPRKFPPPQSQPPSVGGTVVADQTHPQPASTRVNSSSFVEEMDDVEINVV